MKCLKIQTIEYKTKDNDTLFKYIQRTNLVVKTTYNTLEKKIHTINIKREREIHIKSINVKKQVLNLDQILLSFVTTT
jgi:hypothetical protein